jgi:hypothetical protein
MPLANFWHNASVLDGMVYLVGTGDQGSSTLRFDPVSGAWSTLAPKLCNRLGSAAFVVDGCLCVAGGAIHLSSVERYNVANNTWEAVADMLEGRRYFGAVTIGSASPAEEQDLFDMLIAKASSGHL